MTPDTYKVIHIVGLIALFLGIGGMLAGGRKSFALLHGIGLLVVLVAGFGMQAKGNLGFPGWLIGKLAIWVVFAVLPVAYKRKAMPAAFILLGALVLGGLAAWLVVARPF